MDKTNSTATFVGKLCCTILAVLFALPALANGVEDVNTTISGVVTDNNTGEPLIGVTVTIVRDGKIDNGVITDFDGNFSMPTPTGNYEVHISYMGYQTIILKP